MGVDILLAEADVPGIRVALADLMHLLRIIQHHGVVQVTHALHRMYVVQLLNIEIAHPERLLQFHALLLAQAGDHGGSNDKMIF